jgi:hypothetical protein
MIQWLEMTRASADRPARLFAVACCRWAWHVFKDPRSRAAVDAAERYAIGLLPRKDLEVIANRAGKLIRDSVTTPAEYAACSTTKPRIRPGFVALLMRNAVQVQDAEAEDAEEASAQVALLRDIFGNPFRPAALAPEWRTPTAVGLAQGISDDRAFDRMPILADALQDAGCEDEQILAHCRGPGPHVRGCWVVDLILAKR